MRLLQYLELENFKRFGGTQRFELDHPTVFVGPNNCGKTSAMQALALWSYAIRVWYGARKESTATERTSVALNRLNVLSVPVQRTRYFWHNTEVRAGNQDVPLVITVGVWFANAEHRVSMRFRNQGDELVYCRPDDEALQKPDVLAHASSLRVDLLYPMSGLETEEPILQPGRIDVLLGQGQTAQVLRNLCLLVYRTSSDDWREVQRWMRRLFDLELGDPQETPRGSISLQYRQSGVKEALDLSAAGRGFQQMLLLLSYLYTHKGSVLLVDEPDAHLEILRQKQAYLLLGEIADRNRSQIVMATHSEVILEEAADRNLTLILHGRADNLAKRKGIRDSLKHYGAQHYVRARDRGYVLYLEGSTDLDALYSLALLTKHSVVSAWDEKINSYYVQNNFPQPSLETELIRVEGGYGVTPKAHFFAIKSMIPELRGLAILDNDGQVRNSSSDGGLQIEYWEKYEIENYFVTPDVLVSFSRDAFGSASLFQNFETEIQATMESSVLDFVFANNRADYDTFKNSPADAAKLIWGLRTSRMKLSAFAELYFERLASATGGPLLLTKGEFHRLVPFANPAEIDKEVGEKLDALLELFLTAFPGEVAPLGNDA